MLRLLCYVRFTMVFQKTPYLVHFIGDVDEPHSLFFPCDMFYSSDLNIVRILIYNLEGIGGKPAVLS